MCILNKGWKNGSSFTNLGKYQCFFLFFSRMGWNYCYERMVWYIVSEHNARGAQCFPYDRDDYEVWGNQLCFPTNKSVTGVFQLLKQLTKHCTITQSEILAGTEVEEMVKLRMFSIGIFPLLRHCDWDV